MPKITGYFFPYWLSAKYPWGIYSQDQARHPYLYFKCCEGVLVKAITWTTADPGHQSMNAALKGDALKEPIRSLILHNLGHGFDASVWNPTKDPFTDKY